MNAARLYLDRYGFDKTLFSTAPHPDLGLIVVVPCFNETHLINSLQCLNDCLPTRCGAEVIVIINDGEQHPPAILSQNKSTYETASTWAKKHSKPEKQYLIHYEHSLPAKHAGVGFARKIGMDEALRRFNASHKDGVIICFDADSYCQQDYLVKVASHFKDNPNSPGASIYFEHPLAGDYSSRHYEGIIYYELFLRYYINALRYANFPFAYQTIGSSMAVRSDVYAKQGGMNRRKAGEDFYFLQKIIPLGDFTEINNTIVIPSPRDSDRVPFGTGKAIGDWLNHENQLSNTYHLDIFIALKTFLEKIPQLFHLKSDEAKEWVDRLPSPIKAFLNEQGFIVVLDEIKHNCGPTQSGFLRRFYHWFDAFRALKYVHYARDFYYPNAKIEEAVSWLFQVFFKHENPPTSAREQLLKLRALDKNGWEYEGKW